LSDFVAIAAEGRTIVTGGLGERLSFFDALTGQVRLSVRAEPTKAGDAFVDAIAFSPDGRFLANSQRSGVICLRDPTTGRELKRLTVPAVISRGLSFSRDDRWLIVGCSDHTTRVYEVATRQEVWCLQGQQGEVVQVAIGPGSRTVLTTSRDLTALIWSLRPAGVKGLKGTEDALWDDLAGDGPTAYRAVWSMLDDSTAAIDLLSRKLPPPRPVIDTERVRKLIANLDQNDFRVRETAAKALAELGPAAEPILREALRQAKSPEAEQRLRQLVERLKREPTANDWRVGRAVQVLELCGTQVAGALLRRWADSDDGTPLTEEARAALRRLDRAR
jgi:hypothetical protein